jgi:uncharacterized protein YjbI with pentapeptide repeats
METRAVGELRILIPENVVFDGCRLDYAALTRVRATGPVALVDCDLDNATLRRCQLPKTAISGCRLGLVGLDDCLCAARTCGTATCPP